MIDLYCKDARLREQLEYMIALAAEVNCEFDWDDFERRLGGVDCSILVLNRPVEERILLTLSGLSGEATRAEVWAFPMVLITDRWNADQAVALNRIPHSVVSRDDVRECLVDAIAQECARAALCHLRNSVNRSTEMHPLLRQALRVLLRDGFAAYSVRALARKSTISENTLWHHWHNDQPLRGLELSLRGFVDAAALLKARARKTPRLTWGDVASEFSTQKRHYAAISKRLIGHWPGDRRQESWIHLATRMRLASFA